MADFSPILMPPPARIPVKAKVTKGSIRTIAPSVFDGAERRVAFVPIKQVSCACGVAVDSRDMKAHLAKSEHLRILVAAYKSRRAWLLKQGFIYEHSTELKEKKAIVKQFLLGRKIAAQSFLLRPVSDGGI